jgi:ATP-binding cassette subfamily B protein
MKSSFEPLAAASTDLLADQTGGQLTGHGIENALARLEVDLSAELFFQRQSLVLSPQGLGLLDTSALPHICLAQWPLKAGLRLQHNDHAGAGCLELLDAQGRLAQWRFTLANNPDALRLLALFDQAMSPFQDHDKPLPDPSTSDEAEMAPTEEDEGEVADTPPSTLGLLRLWRFAQPYQGHLLMGFLLTLAATGASMVPPYLTMPLMDEVLVPFQNGKEIEPGIVPLYMAGLLAAALLAWALGWAKNYVLGLVSERIGADLRTTAYEHLMKLSLEYFGGRRTGDLLNRVGSETDNLCLFLSVHLLEFATDVLMIVMTAVILFSIDPMLAWVTLVPLPFIVWLIHVVRDKLRTGFEKVGRVWSELTNVLADTIPGIRVVKAFAQEKREADRFREANRQNLLVNDRINFVWALFSPTVTLLTEIGLLVVWAFGIYLVSQHQVTLGVLTAFLAYIGRFYTRLDSMSRIVAHVQRAAAGAKRIFEILDHVSSVPEAANPKPMPVVKGQIDIEDINFRYGNRAVVRGLSLNIAPGEMIGLVGQSGSGKTTLVNLLCRFYDVSDGAIRIDGVDIRELSLSDYRRHIGLVLQEPFLFFGTIAENIAYGMPQASREEIVAAARAAHAHEFIMRLPQAYDSLVGERGQGLSGGERQRISIARALLIDPRILILDEATSSVDSETELEIQRALDNLVRGRTTIAIAHRLSTLQQADRLVVLERGRLVEQGSHADLMKREGAYYRLYEAQARQHEADRVAMAASLVPQEMR